MLYSRVFIQSVGLDLPSEIVPTADLEKKLADVYAKHGLLPDLVEKSTGVRERRFWPPLVSNAACASRAAGDALERAGVAVKDVEALIYGSVCRDALEPATACMVAAHLGLGEDTMVYDIGNACLSMMSGVLDIANRIELGQIRCGLVVGCESAREINVQTIRRLTRANLTLDELYLTLATFTGGSGAAAILLTDGTVGHSRGHRLLGGAQKAHPEHHQLCHWKFVPHENNLETGLYNQVLTTYGSEALKGGVALAHATWDRFLPTLGWSTPSIDRVITHQVGRANRIKLLEALRLDANIEYPTFEYLGNLGAVALPATLALAERDGFIVPGHKVALLGIGSGFNCMMLGVEW